MRAYLATRYGGPEVMRIGELPEPRARKGQVVVAVRASSINPVDWKIRDGELRPMSGYRFPRALGTDFVGIVHALGEDVSGWQVGDHVYGMTVSALGHPGAHAQALAVPSSGLRRKPEFLTSEQAATLPVAGLTALSGMRLCGPLDKKRLLINGATGGVGHFALQIAKARGAHVTAVCSAGNASHAVALGADEVLDYRVFDIAKHPERYDAIYDAYGLLGFPTASVALHPAGVYVTPLGLPRVYLRSILHNLVGKKKLLIGNVRSEPRDYDELEDLLRSGAVRPLIDRVLPLEKAGEAFSACERGGVAGKVVLSLE